VNSPGTTSPRFSYERLNRCILRGEERVPAWLFGLLVALALLAAACLYVNPARRCLTLGVSYAELARHPFSLSPDSPVGYRRLTPAISYCLGLRGEGIILTNLLIALALLYAVYRWARRTLPQPGDAFFAAAFLAFSMPVLSTISFGGYCDALTYLLAFLMWRARRRSWALAGLLFLGLLNHESTTFLIPWFIFLRATETDGGKRGLGVQIGYIALAVALYAGYRHLITQQGPSTMTPGFYLGPIKHDLLYWVRPAAANWPIGLFSVFKLLWVLPILAAVASRREGGRSLFRSQVLLLCCAAAQLFLAYDTTRLLTLAYPVMVFSLAYLFARDVFGIRRWAGWLLLANLAVPQFHTAGRIVAVLYSPLALAWGRLAGLVIGFGGK
jgi:hypothetical protein